MRGRLTGAILICVALWLATTEGQQGEAGGSFVPGELIIKFRSSAPPGQRNALLNAQGALTVRQFTTVDSQLVRLTRGQSVRAALVSFRAQADIVLAQPNYIRKAVAPAPPDDPFWRIGFLWGLEKIQAQQVWTEYTTGSPNVVIADIDTGVDYTHPDLAANMWQNPGEVPGNGIDDDNNGYVDDIFGIDTVNGDSNPMDDQGHGTHTSGTMAAVGNNNEGVVGVTWNSKILACKFIGSNGEGTDADAIECFDYIVALKQRGVNIRISNNSWGSPREDPPATALEAAIDAAGVAGILNVFAAGNNGTDNDAEPFDPAGFASPSILTVAASESNDNRPAFSNYGATTVDLAAPGDGILSTFPGTYGFSSGTSMAAPLVAGAAALLVSQDPSLSPDGLKARLMNTVDLLPQWGGVVVSGGRMNVLSAIAGTTNNPPPTVALTSPIDGAVFGAPATVPLAATATDTDGIELVEFFANGLLIGTDVSEPYAGTWSSMPPGSYTLTAVATDGLGATKTSSPVQITVMPVAGRVNVALAANGGSTVASSTLNSSYPANSVINGDRKGIAWGSGGGWADGTTNGWPDWLEVQFNGTQTIEEVDVFTVQDNYTAPADPTPTMPFTKYGVRDFRVEYWTGNAWQAVPGGAVTGNTLVWRQFTFAPVTTTKIRVFVTQGLASNSRLTEVEVYTAVPGGNSLPTVSLTSPTDNSTFGAPAVVPFAATASDADGISKVEFFANGTLVGTDLSAPYTATWSNMLPGVYTLTAVATDGLGAAKTSSPVQITVTPAIGRVNVALSVNGGSTVASSTLNSNYPANSVINGDRKGLGWGSGGGWADGTTNGWPDWVEVQFNGSQTIEEVGVFTVQDNYSAPSEPTTSMTFNSYGVRDFRVEYWTGTAWQTIPGGAVTANTLVWRQFLFTAVTTTKIRVYVTQGLASNSRLTEIEAYTAGPGGNTPPTVSLTSPAGNSTFGAPATVPLAATAADSDGISKVEFFANGALITTDTSEPYAGTWSNVPPGSYTLTAIATDGLGATKTSSPVLVTVTPAAGRINVALAANGGSTVASSTLNSSYPANSVINGDRKGIAWGSGGGWADGTTNGWPDWLEVQFNGTQTIEEVDVFTVQDNYTAPADPTPTMPFTKYGVRDFRVEYWTGSAWQAVPGGAVTGNTLVWRQFTFAPVTTTKIRVFVTQGLASNSRLTEVEVYSVVGGTRP